MSVITLLTDFGTDDEYAGLMKGVILSINPSAVIVDITHQIDSQDIIQAAFTIHSSYRFFPDGTVHLVVVDPGVGTGRALIALEMGRQFFIAPDNGVLTLLLNAADITAIIGVTNSQYFLTSVSHTFHGRDKIAPVGAHVSRGVELKALGSEIDLADVVRLDELYARILENGELLGKIISIDHFGNLITNIDSNRLASMGKNDPAKTIHVKIGRYTINGLSATYDSVEENSPLALIGSRGYLEVAVNRGCASRYFNAKKGDPVRLFV